MNHYKRKQKESKTNEQISLTPQSIITLYMIYDEPKYPFEIVRLLSEQSFEEDIKVQSVYTLLKKMTNLGWVEVIVVEDRQLYKLTEIGRKQVNERIRLINRINNNMMGGARSG